MTQPPQQPDPYGERGAHGSQPGSGPPSGAWPQSPGYGTPPGAGPYSNTAQGQVQGPPSGTRQFTQPGPYPQPPGTYGPQPQPYEPYEPYEPYAGAYFAYGDAGGRQGPGPAEQGNEHGGGKPKKTGLLVGLATAGALLVAGGLVALILLIGDDTDAGQAQVETGQAEGQPNQEPGGTGGDELPPEPDIQQPREPADDPGDESTSEGSGGTADDEAELRELAEAAMEALNNTDADLARSISCDPTTVDEDQIEYVPGELDFRITGDPVINGDSATIPFEVSGINPETGEYETAGEDLPAEHMDGEWCLSG